MNAVMIITMVSILAYAAAFAAAIETRRRRSRQAFLSAAFALALFSLFAAISLFSDFRTSLSNTGLAVLTAIAAAGLAELLQSVKIMMADRPETVPMDPGD